MFLFDQNSLNCFQDLLEMKGCKENKGQTFCHFWGLLNETYGVGSKKSGKCETLDVAECGEASDVLSHWGAGRLYFTQGTCEENS